MEAPAHGEGAEALAALGQPVLVTKGFRFDKTDTGEGRQARCFRGRLVGREVGVAGPGRIGLAVEG